MDSFYEQSEEIGSAMFSYLSHTAGKQEERKKTDRKTGKERRKATASVKKMLRFEPVNNLVETVATIDTIWCIGRSGHWGTPILDDKGDLNYENFCVDCKHAEEKREKWLKSPEGIAWEAEQEALDRIVFNWQEDYYDMWEAMMEMEWRRNEQRRRDNEHKQRLEAAAAEVADTEDPLCDDYIPEIDDNFDD
jgi:hypothetical protein